MSVEEFAADPWKKSHSAYADSAFNIRPAPEFSTAEVAIASLYRASGFSGYSETAVPKAGRELDRLSVSSRSKPNLAGKIRADTWHSILHGVLESPKQPNQSSKRFLSLSPLVPNIALYSGSARLAGNSWNPGALLKRMIQLGAPNQEMGAALWGRLHEALSVNEDDDIWARWLQEEFLDRRPNDAEWEQTDFEQSGVLPDEEKAQLRYPAIQFVKDLDAIIQAKSSMTRRQWISVLEAVVRLGSVSHVLWLCRVNDRLWKAVGSILGHGQGIIPSSKEQLRNEIVMGEPRSLSYGKAAVPTIKDYASRYLLARLGLNLVLWALKDEGKEITSLQSVNDLWKFLQAVKENAAALGSRNTLDTFLSIYDKEARTIGCKKGVGANLVEFSRHTLGQRQTTNDALRGYDQGYFLHKRGESRNAPWVLSLGPVAVLAVVHCCLNEVKGPRSVQRLAGHLAWYGIEIDAAGINQNDLGKNLRMLGLVLDSPDAESGMLLIPPFGNHLHQGQL